VTRLKWKLILIHLDIVLILTQDRGMVFTEHTVGSKLFLTHQMGLLSYVGHMESHFSPFGDGVSVDAR
jgi:hypothetical protein